MRHLHGNKRSGNHYISFGKVLCVGRRILRAVRARAWGLPHEPQTTPRHLVDQCAAPVIQVTRGVSISFFEAMVLEGEEEDVLGDVGQQWAIGYCQLRGRRQGFLSPREARPFNAHHFPAPVRFGHIIRLFRDGQAMG